MRWPTRMMVLKIGWKARRQKCDRKTPGRGREGQITNKWAKPSALTEDRIASDPRRAREPETIHQARRTITRAYQRTTTERAERNGTALDQQSWPCERRKPKEQVSKIRRGRNPSTRG